MEISALDVKYSNNQKTHKLCFCEGNAVAGKMGKQIIMTYCDFFFLKEKESIGCYGNIKQMDLSLATGSEKMSLEEYYLN